MQEGCLKRRRVSLPGHFNTAVSRRMRSVMKITKTGRKTDLQKRKIKPEIMYFLDS